MELRKLGRLGPEISVVGFGAWEAGGDVWGPNESEESVIHAIHAGIEAGLNWIDTAEVYGKGRSEELVGKALRGRRDDVLIFTKVAPNWGGSGFRPEEVKGAMLGSLARLDVENVDLYQLHWPNPRIPVEETWGAMAELQDQGLTRFIGVSNFGKDLVERCLAIRHVDSVQNEFSLLSQEDRSGLLPWLDESGVGYLAFSPLAKGMLTGAIRPDTVFDPSDFRGGSRGEVPEVFRTGARERNMERVDRLRPIAERIGTDVATLTLRWALEQRGVTAVIAGSRNAAHSRANAAAGTIQLDGPTLAEIDSIFS
jgi:aryl-alcohol dehydrogenase-like predicted oxidoreductase